MKLSKQHTTHIKNLFEKICLFEKHNTLQAFSEKVADYLIDDKIYTDDWNKQSEETPLLIPNVNFGVHYKDDFSKPFELTIEIKNEKLILGENYD